MKSIQITKTTEKVLTPQGTFANFPISTLDLIKTATNDAPPGGFNASDMLNRIKILEEVEKSEAKFKEETEKTQVEETDKIKPFVFELEDDLFEKLGGYVKGVKWGFISRRITDFVDLFK